MKLTNFIYLFSILLFTGPIILKLWRRESKILKRYEWVVIIIVAMGTCWAAFDIFSLRWNLWYYYPAQNLNIRFGTVLETYIWAAVVSFIIAAVTLVYAQSLDRKAVQTNARKNSKKRQPKLKPRRVFGAAGATRR